MMTATEILPIIENYNVGNICTIIADIYVADTGTIAVPVIADKGVNIAELRILPPGGRRSVTLLVR